MNAKNLRFGYYLLISYAMLLLLLAPLFLLFEKGEILLWVNSHNTPLLDIFFKYYTDIIGNGALYFVLIMFLTIGGNYYYTIYGLTVALIDVCVSLLFKKVLFSDMSRPIGWLENTDSLHFLEGVTVHSSQSFPSGHTITSFTVVLFVTLMSKRKSWIFPLFILGLLGAYSRMYLLQHFFIDVYFGTLFATISCLGLWFYIEQKTSLPNNKRLRSSLSTDLYLYYIRNQKSVPNIFSILTRFTYQLKRAF